MVIVQSIEWLEGDRLILNADVLGRRRTYLVSRAGSPIGAVIEFSASFYDDFSHNAEVQETMGRIARRAFRREQIDLPIEIPES